MSLNLHVEQLTLDNLELSPGQRSRFQSALQHELTRLMSEQGIPPSLHQDGYLPSISLDASHVRLRDAVQLGQHVARSIYGNLRQGTPVDRVPHEMERTYPFAPQDVQYASAPARLPVPIADHRQTSAMPSPPTRDRSV